MSGDSGYESDRSGAITIWFQPGSARVGAEEQITTGTAQQVGNAAPGKMVRPVVNEMAALA